MGHSSFLFQHISLGRVNFKARDQKKKTEKTDRLAEDKFHARGKALRSTTCDWYKLNMGRRRRKTDKDKKKKTVRHKMQDDTVDEQVKYFHDA